MAFDDKKLIILAIVACVAGLVIMIGFIGQGNVRGVQIFFQEKVEQTVAFQDINNQTKIVGISGISGENPTLIMRNSFAYILTVENQGDKPHKFYIDGFEVETKLLQPGSTDSIIVFPSEEGTYNYYDKVDELVLLGQLKSVTVVPSDEFEGIAKDLI